MASFYNNQYWYYTFLNPWALRTLELKNYFKRNAIAQYNVFFGLVEKRKKCNNIWNCLNSKLF